jgi:hypothetical protein
MRALGQGKRVDGTAVRLLGEVHNASRILFAWVQSNRRKRGAEMIYLPLTELLAGVAEEAAELAQAALKLRRVIDGTNPTPKPKEEAIDAFEEEIADLQIYLDRIAYSRQHVANIKKVKAERWATRLSNNNKTEQKFAPQCTTGCGKV